MIAAVKKYLKSVHFFSDRAFFIKTFLMSLLAWKNFKILNFFLDIGKFFAKRESNKSLDKTVYLQACKNINKGHRSIVFWGDSYYCYYYLAMALRKREWKALCVSPYPPSTFMHGTDLVLYDQNPERHQDNLAYFFNSVMPNYKMLHFYSNLLMQDSYINQIIPIDIIHLKNAGIKIGYTPSGCMEACTQTEIFRATNGLCNKCVWQNNFKVCSDQKNYNLINKVKKVADFISYETDGSIGINTNNNSYPIVNTEPLLYVLDPEHWGLDLEIPEKYKIHRDSKDHVIILTAFANQHFRNNEHKDIKGIRATYSAINNLRDEGFLIQHIHLQNIPSKDMRYMQAQADIIIDQLNYGRYGAFAREGMMLGKPVICKIDYLSTTLKNLALKECPLINANEDTIYAVLKQLLMSSSKELEVIGKKSRDYMIKWHSPDICAERFEKIYDNLLKG